MTRQELISESKRRYENGAEIEKIIEFLRSSGCSKIDCIAIVAQGCGVGLAKAKELIHFSPAWSDTRTADEMFHDMVVNTISSADFK